MLPYRLVRDLDSLSTCLDQLERQPVVGLDTETTGLDPFTSRIRLVQLSVPGQAFLIDCFQLDPFKLPRFVALLESDRPIKILHNAKFDARMFDHHAGIRLRGVFDSFLASQLIAAGAHVGSHSLAAVVERHTGEAMDKSERLSDWSAAELSDPQLEYAANDVLVLPLLRDRMVERIRALGLVEVAKLEFDCAHSVARMENAGIYIDRRRWLDLCDVVEKSHKLLREQLATELATTAQQMTLFGEADINLDSPAQVLEAFQRMGIPLTGTRASELESFAAEHPIIGRFLGYRTLSKQLTSYGRGFLDHVHAVTGRIHPSFMQIGAPSGRMACADPSVQQIPNGPEYRECIRAPEGRLLVTADYSQIELRIVADWAQDTSLIKAFQSGEDLHKVTASQMFNIPLAEVSKRERTAAKSLNFGLLYGMGAQGLAWRIHSSVAEAERLIRKYFAAYSGVEAWLHQAAESALANRSTRTRSGRLVVFEFDPSDRVQVSGITRVGKNVPIQGTSADILKAAMTILEDELAPFGARIVNAIHDELVVECHEGVADEVAKTVRLGMEKAGRRYIRSIPVVVDTAVGPSWTKS
jgi:DNA polymerase I-like protein with 3'-5' exonuclease and polymerase domains